MIDIKIDIRGINEMTRYLQSLLKQTQKRITKAKHDIGKLIVDKSKENAPKDNGDLENSIKYRLKGNDIIIYVPPGSKAGGYAYYVHEGKYKLGDKSKSKGGKVGPKFIERAITGNLPLIEDELQAIFRGI